MDRLLTTLRRIDGRSYKAYKDVRGRYSADGWDLCIDRVQGDPFAAPSQIRVILDKDFAGFRPEDLSSKVRRVALADFLTRRFAEAASRKRGRRMGSGSSGLIEAVPCGQEILERSSCDLLPEGEVTFRFRLGLPAQGRRVLGHVASELFSRDVPALVRDSLRRASLEGSALRRHLDAAEDQRALRAELRPRGLVAFLADGACLPRISGADDAPLEGTVVPLLSPPSMTVTLRAPHAGEVTGLGIPKGVTLIVGGGYHGKSTLLSAVARSVYDHVPGDGRELCATDEDAVFIRAEDGRSISGVDIGDFVGDLPLGRRTERFSTDDASGSTSQAAGIVEAWEAGARVLLIDEDTAATNFMIRDRRMRRLVPDNKEPITPFIDRVRALHDEQDISTVMVLGGSGDYLDVADKVLCMEEYAPRDATEDARRISEEIPARDGHEPSRAMRPPAPRAIAPGCLDPRRGRRAESVKAVRTREILFGESEIDVSLVHQLVDPAQARAIGDALLEMSRRARGGSKTVGELLDLVESRLDEEGVVSLQQGHAGDRARARRHELAAALNRLRTLEVE